MNVNGNIGSVQRNLYQEYQRQMISFIASAYKKAQNELRKNAPEVYMKHFPVIQGVEMDIYLNRMSDLFNSKRLSELSKVFFEEENAEIEEIYLKKRGKK